MVVDVIEEVVEEIEEELVVEVVVVVELMDEVVFVLDRVTRLGPEVIEDGAIEPETLDGGEDAVEEEDDDDDGDDGDGDGDGFINGRDVIAEVGADEVAEVVDVVLLLVKVGVSAVGNEYAGKAVKDASIKGCQDGIVTPALSFVEVRYSPSITFTTVANTFGKSSGSPVRWCTGITSPSSPRPVSC